MFISICISSFIVDGLSRHLTLVSVGLGNVTFIKVKQINKSHTHSCVSAHTHTNARAHELQVYYEPSRIYQYFTLIIKELLINKQHDPYSVILKETLNIIQGNNHHK